MKKLLAILLLGCPDVLSQSIITSTTTNGGVVYNLKAYGAKFDVVAERTGISITSGAATLTCTSCTFTSADVGKQIVVPGAAAAAAILKTTIATFTDATHVVLTANAGTTVSGGTDMYYGTDDNAAWVAAIAALPTGSVGIGGGGTLEVPCGRSITTATIVFLNNNSKIHGCNQNSSVLYPAGSITGTVFKYSVDGTILRYIKTENLTINCASFTSLNGFTLNGLSHSQFYDDGAIYCNYGVTTGGTTGNNYTILFNGGIYNHNSMGIHDGGQQSANDWTLINVTAAVNATAGLWWNSFGLSVIGGDFESNAYGVFIGDGSSPSVGGISITGGYFEANVTAQIRIGTATADGLVRGATISGNYLNGSTSTTSGIYCGWADSIAVSNNTFANHATNTMIGLSDGATQGCDNVTWDNNYIIGTGTLSLSGTKNNTLIAGIRTVPGVVAATYGTATNCAGVGTAASPSVASCGSASAGHFSCATAATGATCKVNTTAVTANSEIFVFESDTTVTGTALGVTCNTSTNVNPASRLLASSVAATSFTINLGTVTTNPACFSYYIVN